MKINANRVSRVSGSDRVWGSLSQSLLLDQHKKPWSPDKRKIYRPIPGSSIVI
jgi:hypothetical protein